MDENGNIVDTKDDNLADEVKKWLQHCSKTLDFVYSPDIMWVKRYNFIFTKSQL